MTAVYPSSKTRETQRAGGCLDGDHLLMKVITEDDWPGFQGSYFVGSGLFSSALFGWSLLVSIIHSLRLYNDNIPKSTPKLSSGELRDALHT